MTIDQAMAVFAGGFAFARSITHPYLANQLRPNVWLLRDAPRDSGDYRSEEYIAWRVKTSILDQLARRHTRGQYRICVLHAADESDTAIRSDFRALGYRLRGTEPLMVHRLKRIAAVPKRHPVIRIATPDQAHTLAKAAGHRLILPGHLDSHPAPIRQYMALDRSTPVGWASSIVVGHYTWCHSMYVCPSHRRRGIARSLLIRMLTDDRAEGSTANVLLSSHAGAHLYSVVGYELIGGLLTFVPPRERPHRDRP